MSKLNGHLTADVFADALEHKVSEAELLDHIHRALEITGGRRRRAARLLGISERTIRRLLGPKPGHLDNPNPQGNWGPSRPRPPKSIAVSTPGTP